MRTFVYLPRYVGIQPWSKKYNQQHSQQGNQHVASNATGTNAVVVNMSIRSNVYLFSMSSTRNSSSVVPTQVSKTVAIAVAHTIDVIYRRGHLCHLLEFLCSQLSAMTIYVDCTNLSQASVSMSTATAIFAGRGIAGVCSSSHLLACYHK